MDCEEWNRVNESLARVVELIKECANKDRIEALRVVHSRLSRSSKAAWVKSRIYARGGGVAAETAATTTVAMVDADGRMNRGTTACLSAGAAPPMLLFLHDVVEHLW